MKKQFIAALSALALTFTSLPCAGLAAENEIKPVLRYTFDGADALTDENGKNALTLSGGASVTYDGNTGKALLLDGTDGFAKLPDNILTDSMTITAWVNITKFTTWGRVFDFGTDSDNNFFFAPYGDSAARIEMKSNANAVTLDTDRETVKNEWINYAVTVDGGTVSYYRNGRLISSKSGMYNTSEIGNSANYIGKSHYESDAYLAAAIDDFRVYDTALSQSEISAVMAEGNISGGVILDSYAIEDEQIITGSKIELPQFDGMEWSEKDEKGLINLETGAVTHNETAETVTLIQSYGDAEREYTLYITGENKNPYTVNIDASDKSKDVSDIMWGLFFEDINSSADGGLYAEMVENGSFENPDSLYSWEANNAVINTANPMNENNPTYITLGGTKTSGREHDGGDIVNDGYMGMSIKEGAVYDFSMYVRGVHADPDMISVSLDGQSITLQAGEETENDWIKLEGNITADKTSSNATLEIYNIPTSGIDIDCVSLMPEDTYKGHGLRKDLMEQLEAMHPKFLRFPGGCAVEGNTMDEAWNWKDTVGDVSERKQMPNIWGYQMTYGLGFYEYFQMCEDLDMEPVPILNCGLACQVRSGGKTDENYVVPMDDLQPYIDDALDLIEFANGTDENNEWVQLRIKMGHKEPFNMKYIGIGNEQYGDIYFERYAEFAKQIHEKYPDINLVTTSGTASSGTSNDLAWNWANENTELADRMDEHYYETADWFRQHAYRYDNYRRDTNTKVFLGEYASKGNTWYNALSEAAFMTGLERNADVVRMASYAPMFAKYGNTQWTAANMIWFNNDDYVLTPNYYVQSLFSNNQGDYSLPTEVKLSGIEKDDTLHGSIALGSWGTQNEFKDVAVTTADGNTKEITFDSDLWSASNGEWSVSDDGILSQTSDQTGSVYFLNDESIDENYTLSLKAKKLGGGEGFQVGVAAEDGLNYYRINVGGWSNTTAKVQHIIDGVSAAAGSVAEQSYVGDVHIEDDEWYDVKVEVSDYEIKAYLNNEFICSYIKPSEYGPIYSSSVYDEETGDIIVKLVNTTDNDVNIGMNISGEAIASDTAKVTVMSGDTSLENSLDNKNAIAPYESEITNVSDSFTYNAPADSFSIIRLKTGDDKKPYISGYDDGTFRPDNTITRAEAAAMIARSSKDFDESKQYNADFADVSGNEWYADYIGYAAEKGYVSGYEGNVFKPENTITRAEFAVMLAKYSGTKKSDSNESFFVDEDECAWAADYINAMYKSGYVSGYDENSQLYYKPNNTITRAETVTMMNKILNYTASETDVNPFSDVSATHWAYSRILAAVN